MSVLFKNGVSQAVDLVMFFSLQLNLTGSRQYFCVGGLLYVHNTEKKKKRKTSPGVLQNLKFEKDLDPSNPMLIFYTFSILNCEGIRFLSRCLKSFALDMTYLPQTQSFLWHGFALASVCKFAHFLIISWLLSFSILLLAQMLPAVGTNV